MSDFCPECHTVAPWHQANCKTGAINGGGQNIGHGHVYLRPDGVVARCGGPGLCAECSRDAARKANEGGRGDESTSRPTADNRLPVPPSLDAPHKTDRLGVCWQCGGALLSGHVCHSMLSPALVVNGTSADAPREDAEKADDGASSNPAPPSPDALLPCPFCGHVGVTVRDGSTFRWLVAQCDECGAQAGEARVQTMGAGTREEWEAKGVIDAIALWNERAAPTINEPRIGTPERQAWQDARTREANERMDAVKINEEKAGSIPARLPRSGETGGGFDSREMRSGEPKGTAGPAVKASAESGAGATINEGGQGVDTRSDDDGSSPSVPVPPSPDPVPRLTRNIATCDNHFTRDTMQMALDAIERLIRERDGAQADFERATDLIDKARAEVEALRADAERADAAITKIVRSCEDYHNEAVERHNAAIDAARGNK